MVEVLLHLVGVRVQFLNSIYNKWQLAPFFSMPNTLVVSTFGCPFSEFEMMVNKVDKEQGYVFCSELEIIKVNEHKAMILMNCSDLEKFGAMLEQPELKQWDIDNNCVDTVYNLGLVE